MSRVAFLGIGAMGSRMAAHLLGAGHELTVWNTVPAPALDRLVSSGARKAGTPREAAEANDFVIAMVSNDEASREVWLDGKKGALGGLKQGAVAIESSTLTPAWVRELAAAVGQAGAALLDAMVSGSTPQAESAELVYLVGGEAAALERARPLFEAMGRSVQHAGPNGAGALAKLATNTFMAVEIAALAELIAMLRKQGVDPEPVLHAVSQTPLWSDHLTRDAESMLRENFEPQFPIKLLEKDLGYTVNTAGGDAAMPTVSAVRRVFQSAIDGNLDDENMTAVVKLFGKAS